VVAVSLGNNPQQIRVSTRRQKETGVWISYRRNLAKSNLDQSRHEHGGLVNNNVWERPVGHTQIGCRISRYIE